MTNVFFLNYVFNNDLLHITVLLFFILCYYINIDFITLVSKQSLYYYFFQ